MASSRIRSSLSGMTYSRLMVGMTGAANMILKEPYETRFRSSG